MKSLSLAVQKLSLRLKFQTKLQIDRQDKKIDDVIKTVIPAWNCLLLNMRHPVS